MRADAMRRRGAILATARRLFSEHGGDMPLESIAQESGVGIATLYRNFASREELVLAVTADTVEQILSAVEECRGRLDVDAALAWDALLDRLVCMELGALTDAFASWDADRSPDGARELQERARLALEELLDELVRRGAVRGGLSALEVIVAVATVTRVQHEPIRLAAPEVQGHLVEAFRAWSRGVGPGAS